MCQSESQEAQVLVPLLALISCVALVKSPNLAGPLFLKYKFDIRLPGPCQVDVKKGITNKSELAVKMA